MATKKKVTELSPTSTLDNADLLHVVDVSDTTQDPAGSSKKLTLGDLVTHIQDGLSVSDKNYSQAFNGSTVVVNHNLGKKPAVTVIASSGDEVYGQIVYNSDNQLTLTFSASFVGVVYCN